MSVSLFDIVPISRCRASRCTIQNWVHLPNCRIKTDDEVSVLRSFHLWPLSLATSELFRSPVSLSKLSSVTDDTLQISDYSSLVSCYGMIRFRTCCKKLQCHCKEIMTSKIIPNYAEGSCYTPKEQCTRCAYCVDGFGFVIHILNGNIVHIGVNTGDVSKMAID